MSLVGKTPRASDEPAEGRHRAPPVACLVAALVWVAVACTAEVGDQPGKETEVQEGSEVEFSLTSTAFAEGDPIPVEHTCDGDNISPPLAWTGIPDGARSLALVCDDPDAPSKTWVHWVMYDLPPTLTELQEAVPDDRELEFGGAHGTNDFKNLGYGGPCPPTGSPHRYHFKLYALDKRLNLDPGATKEGLESAIEGHVLSQAELVGTYERR